MTDAEDRERALTGDGEAFGRLFDRHRGRVFRHSLRLVPRWADADDVVAIVFLEAWRRRASVRLVDGSILPWLLVVASNASLNVSRASRRFRSVIDRLPPPSPAPDHAARFDAGDARAALARLSPAHREVIALCILEGFSEAEAAAALGIPRGTVKSRLFRATRDLRRTYPAIETTALADRTQP